VKTLAQVNFGPASGLPLQDVAKTGDLVSRVLGAVYIVAGICFFVLLVFGAYGIITGAGNPEKAKAGKASATSALIGFLLIFASYWIIQIVEVITGLNIL
jgi:hypothetical protein